MAHAAGGLVTNEGAKQLCPHGEDPETWRPGYECNQCILGMLHAQTICWALGHDILGPGFGLGQLIEICRRCRAVVQR